MDDVDGRDKPGHDGLGPDVTRFIHQGRQKAGGELARTMRLV